MLNMDIGKEVEMLLKFLEVFVVALGTIKHQRISESCLGSALLFPWKIHTQGSTAKKDDVPLY